MKNYQKLLLALILGLGLGTLLHGLGYADALMSFSQNFVEPFGQLFLRLIFMTVVPVVFCGLVLGVYQLSHHKGLGRTVNRTITYTIVASTLSVLIGVSLVNGLKPGVGLDLPASIALQQAAQVDKIKSNAAASKSFSQAIIEIVPKNPLQSAVAALDGEMIALMFFALMLGFALSRVVAAPKGDSVPNAAISAFETIYNAAMEIVHLVMRLAPYAVFALVFSTSLKFGWTLIVSLSYYVMVVVAGLLIQQFIVYSALLKVIAKRSPLAFFKAIYDVMIYAFATASSNATLPRSLAAATEKLHLSPQSSRFVLTVGSTANQNGTALFEGVTVLFLAQVYGVDLSVSQQIQVVLMSILAGIGTAGVPGGSLPLIMILLQQVGIPPEGLGLVLGVDRFLDMCRTTVNVTGDLVIAALVDKAPTPKSVQEDGPHPDLVTVGT